MHREVKHQYYCPDNEGEKNMSPHFMGGGGRNNDPKRQISKYM